MVVITEEAIAVFLVAGSFLTIQESRQSYPGHNQIASIAKTVNYRTL